MIKSRAKQGFYILLLSAITYVMLMIFSLDNTHVVVVEGLLTTWTPSKTENTATAVTDKASDDEVAFQQDINKYRNSLDARIRDLKTNPPSDIQYNTTAYTSIMWATLATVLLFVIFTEIES